MEKKKIIIRWRKGALTICCLYSMKKKGEEEIRKGVFGGSKKLWRRDKYKIGRYMGLLGISPTFGPHVIFQKYCERSVYLIKYDTQ